jgi:predicted O-methyltransferase YrrM
VAKRPQSPRVSVRSGEQALVAFHWCAADQGSLLRANDQQRPSSPALSKERHLPAIDLNVAEQLSLLAQFRFREELRKCPLEPAKHLEFYYNNGSFEAGDAEYLYSLIRLVKPRRVIEIGSGYSTLMSRNAIRENEAENSSYSCDHVCIEPYEQPWLEELGIRIIRRRVEECEIDLFRALDSGDILFIDSSHVIRPQGDVLFEILELLPLLKPGVFVHIHDIFTPRDYPREWVIDQIRLWNEQYLLECFLAFNNRFRVMGALNFLRHHYPEALGEQLPIIRAAMEQREPGSFWIVRQRGIRLCQLTGGLFSYGAGRAGGKHGR